MNRHLRRLVRFSFTSWLLVAAVFPACSKRGEGERCDNTNAGNDDCEDGLICVEANDLADDSADRCCPPDFAGSGPCARGVTGTGGTGGGAGTGGNGGTAGAAGNDGSAGSDASDAADASDSDASSDAQTGTGGTSGTGGNGGTAGAAGNGGSAGQLDDAGGD
jgi:hypothetical protein